VDVVFLLEFVAERRRPGLALCQNTFCSICHRESAPHGCKSSCQAKLHIALDLGDASGDGGYTFGKGPAAAAGVRNSSNSASGPTKEVEMQGLDSAGKAEEDASLQHSASQVWPLLAICAASRELSAHGLQQWWAFIDTWDHTCVWMRGSVPILVHMQHMVEILVW
jgi:hypothetical protein